MGCGCDMGCNCAQKLGQQGEKGGINPLWFVLGAGAGVGLWYLIKSMGAKDQVGPGQTVAAPMPAVTPPSRYGNLQAIAVRLDQVKTLYRSGQLSPEQALAEAENLITAANSFSLQEGERVNEVIFPILQFKAEVEDFIQLKREQIPAASGSPRVSAYA